MYGLVNVDFMTAVSSEMLLDPLSYTDNIFFIYFPELEEKFSLFKTVTNIFVIDECIKFTHFGKY